ncbi:MAG: glycosyltransferase [Ginsengibacter sp.]
MIFITIFIFAVYAALIIYYRQSWLRIPTDNKDLTINNGPSTTVSIIISARDEEKNIYDCLRSIVSQTYPKQLFEVIVIDDHSTDATAEIIQSFSDKNVSLVSLKDFTENENINSYKKKAIEIAISKATGDLIITTDADCIVPFTWLRTIAAFYEKYSPAFIAAPVDYFFVSLKREGLWVRFLKNFQSLDFMTLQGITGAAVYKKFHSMCNGANLAYEKKAFYEVEGYKSIDTIASGDDMLLMHKIYKKYPGRVLFLKSGNAIVKTKPMETLIDFFNQRIRWASKADKYSDKKIMTVLIFVYLFNVWILVMGLSSFFYHFIFYWFLALLFAKIICELFFLYPVAKFFNKEKMLWWFPVAQPFHIVYIIISGWLGKFGSYRWKERKVK